MENSTSDAKKRRKEIKEKLEILNAKKHSLVQVLKQVTYLLNFGVNGK